MLYLKFRRALLSSAFVLIALISSAARADLLTFTISPASLVDTPGGTVTFTGTITNDTGVALSATDMFLNFSGFNPLVITSVTQLLGSPDFTLPNMSVSAPVDLFSVAIAPQATSGTYSLNVSVEDINNNLSNAVTASVAVVVPEPSTYVLVAIALVAIMVSRRIGTSQGVKYAGGAFNDDAANSE